MAESVLLRIPIRPKVMLAKFDFPRPSRKKVKAVVRKLSLTADVHWPIAGTSLVGLRSTLTKRKVKGSGNKIQKFEGLAPSGL